MARIIESSQLPQAVRQAAVDSERVRERLGSGARRLNDAAPAAATALADRADISNAAIDRLAAERDGLPLAQANGADPRSLLAPGQPVYHTPSPLAAGPTAPPPTPDPMQALTGSIALAIMGALNGSGLAQQAQQAAADPGTEPPAGEPPAATPTAPEPAAEPTAPPPPTTAQLGDYTIDDITAGEDGSLTGRLDLTAYGLGTQQVSLQTDADGGITGATALESDLSVNLGGGPLRIEGGDGGPFFSIDRNGTLTFSGQAVMEVAGREVTLGQAEATAGRDDAGRRMLSIEGTAAMGGGEFSATVSESGAFSARISTDMVGALVPGFDQVTGFLDRVGVSLDAGGSGASVAFDPSGALSFDINGLRGGYDDTTGDVSFGGLSVGAGVSLSLEDVTINTRTGAVSAEVSGGIGIGVSGLEVGVDLAGARFAYDPENDRITLSKRDGIAAANVTTTVTLDRNATTGLYLPSSVTFQANVDTQLARDVAAGLNQAYQGGIELGNQAMGQLDRINAYGEQAVGDFAKGLANAGADTRAFLNRAADFTGDNLRNFLSAGAQAGDQLGNLIGRAGNLTGNNLNRFLSNAASGGEAFVRGFESTLGMLGKIAGGYTGLTIDQNGGVSAKVNVANIGRMTLSFQRDGDNLVGSGSLSFGGASFRNASVTFNDKGMLTAVSGSTSLRTPSLKWHGIGIGAQSLTFSLGLDGKGNLNATASARIDLGWLGKHGIDFTLGTGGISGKVS